MQYSASTLLWAVTLFSLSSAQDAAVPTSDLNIAASLIETAYGEILGTPFPASEAALIAPEIETLGAIVAASPGIVSVLQAAVTQLGSNPAGESAFESEFGINPTQVATSGQTAASGATTPKTTTSASNKTTSTTTTTTGTASANSGSTSTSKGQAAVATAGVLMSGVAAAAGLLAVGLI